MHRRGLSRQPRTGEPLRRDVLVAEFGPTEVSHHFVPERRIIHIPHQLHRGPPDPQQVLLIPHARPEHLQPPIQRGQQSLLISSRLGVLIRNHLHLAQDMALEHRIMRGAQRGRRRVGHRTSHLVPQHADVLLELVDIAALETEQCLPDAEIEHLGDVTSVVHAEILFEGLPSASGPGSFDGEGGDTVHRVRGHALDVVEQDVWRQLSAKTPPPRHFVRGQTYRAVPTP